MIAMEKPSKIGLFFRQKTATRILFVSRRRHCESSLQHIAHVLCFNKGFAEIPCIDFGSITISRYRLPQFYIPLCLLPTRHFFCLFNAVLCIFMRSLGPCILSSVMGSGFNPPQLYEIIVCLKRKKYKKKILPVRTDKFRIIICKLYQRLFH